MIDLDELERKAEYATKGIWESCAVRVDDDKITQAISVNNEIIIESIGNSPQDSKNIDFIEAFNPSVAQELIRRLREAEAERDDLRDKLMTNLEESFDLQQELNALKTHCSPYTYGDRVKKRKGSQWQGRIVGWYSTSLTPEGYAVESESHPGSVQIYPAAALEFVGREVDNG